MERLIVRALDGFSERVMRDTGGDKTAGQQLAKEALKIERQQLDGKDQTRTQNQDQLKQSQEQIKEQAKVQDLRPGNNDRARGEEANATRRTPTVWRKSNDGQRVSEPAESRKSADSNGSGKIEINETRRTVERNEVRESETRRIAERNEARRNEMNETRRNEMNESRRTAERNEVRRTAERNEARKAELETRRTAEAKEIRRGAEAKEARRATEAKTANGTADAPSLLDGRKWQKDGSGNFVAKDKDGRLITQDAKGKIVDYQSHVNQKHMANQDQMAFMSILFCNPLMMMGMGAGLAIMDQTHAAKTAKLAESLGPKFDGKHANKTANQTGYAGDMSRKAMLIAQYTRPMESQELSQMNGLAGMKGAALSEREELRKQDLKRKQKIDDRTKQPTAKASMPVDRYSMSTKKLLKTKRLIEEEIERVRGKASLEEVSRLYSQVEVLEKALKRMENF